MEEKSPVMKALRLLGQIAAFEEPPTLAVLSRTVKLPKPTTFRLARALEAAGYITKDPLTLRYQVSAGFETVAFNGLRNSAARARRRLLMNELAERIGARINLVVLKAGNLTFVQWVESTAPLRVDVSSDLPMPIHCSASGKLLVAFGPAELQAVVLRGAPYKSYTKNTITTSRGLAREFDAIRCRGYSMDDQELIPGVNCIAVPIRNRSGKAVAALAVMAPSASLPLEGLQRFLPDLRACVARLSAEFSPADAEKQARQFDRAPDESRAAPAPSRTRQTRRSRLESEKRRDHEPDTQRRPKHPEDHRRGRASQ